MHTRNLSRSVKVLMALVLACSGLVAAPVRAQAAVVDATITNLVVSPPTGSAWRTFTTTFDWCVPDGSQPGDSFVVGLPDLLGTWPTTFPLESSSGVVVANGVINAGPPSYLTVTLGDAVTGQSNVCGTVDLQSQARNGAALGGTTQQLVFDTPTGPQTTEVSFDELVGPGAGATTVATKEGWFASVDQCRTDGTDCLYYAISTPAGPTDADVRIVDAPPAGQSIDCTALSLFWRDAQGNWVRGLNDTRWTLNSCTATGLDLTVHGLLDGLQAVVQFPVSVPPNPAGDVTYTNTATVTVGDQTPGTPAVRMVSNKAVGTATGSAILVDKHDVDGNKADTAETAASLPDGTTGIEITYTNRGLDSLDTIVVEDTTIVGTGRVENLSCDFSQAVAGAPTSGTTWAGPWPTGTTFTCTGRLVGVTPPRPP